jgi:hypothetical protein
LIKAEEAYKGFVIFALSQKFVGDSVKVGFGDLPYTPSRFEDSEARRGS